MIECHNVKWNMRSVSTCRCYFFCRNAYHGASPGTLGILAHNTWKLNVPLGFGFFQVKLGLRVSTCSSLRGTEKALFQTNIWVVQDYTNKHVQCHDLAWCTQHASWASPSSSILLEKSSYCRERVKVFIYLDLTCPNNSPFRLWIQMFIKAHGVERTAVTR